MSRIFLSHCIRENDYLGIYEYLGNGIWRQFSRDDLMEAVAEAEANRYIAPLVNGDAISEFPYWLPGYLNEPHGPDGELVIEAVEISERTSKTFAPAVVAVCMHRYGYGREVVAALCVDSEHNIGEMLLNGVCYPAIDDIVLTLYAEQFHYAAKRAEVLAQGSLITA